DMLQFNFVLSDDQRIYESRSSGPQLHYWQEEQENLEPGNVCAL
ncbi:hypothetical protein NPIL_666181, partial [Nephila pilipes]